MDDKPQQPELERSGRTPVDKDSLVGKTAERMPRGKGRTGRVPEDNRQGHRPAKDQDKPGGARR